MVDRVIIGLGSGRCGTASLARLLDQQPGAIVTHEKSPHLPWEVSATVFAFRALELVGRLCRVGGDVAFNWLPYVRLMMSTLDSVRFVCLRRDRDECVASLKAKMDSVNTNAYQNHDCTRWRASSASDYLPKYDNMPMVDAIGCYYDEYYAKAEQLQSDDDRFHIFPTVALNCEVGVNDILDFCGFTDKVIRVGIRENAGLSC